MTLKIRVIFIIFVTLLISISLINNDIFGNSTLAAYFGYVNTAALISFIFTTITFKQKIQIPNSLPIILFGCLCIYYFFQTIILEDVSFNHMHIFLLTNFFLLVVLSFLFKRNQCLVSSIYKIIILVACIESLECIFQFLGIIKSKNQFFVVTGSWINPNVIAMFLALAIPALLVLIFQSKKLYHKLYITALILIVTALILLKCRTALLGSIISSALVLNFQYNIISQIKMKIKGLQLIFLIFAFTSLAIIASILLYNLKKNSADGRMLIWKISADMIKKQPILGIGIGMFERNYNLEQSNYFSLGNGTKTEIANASFVYMAYNEFLQNTVEGGVIGLFLFILFLVSLLMTKKVQTKEIMAAKAAIISFVVMSFTNFTVQAIPVICLFIIYAAIISSWTMPLILKKINNFQITTLRNRLINLFIITVSVIIFTRQIVKANAFIQTTNALNLVRENDTNQAIEILEPFSLTLNNSDIYWNTYGLALMQQRKFEEAIQKFNNALNTTSNPDIFLQSSFCYQQLKQYDSAKQYTLIAKNLMPSKIAPMFILMKIYTNTFDTLNANRIAKEIISTTPKIVSDESNFYKQEAQAQLKNQ